MNEENGKEMGLNGLPSEEPKEMKLSFEKAWNGFLEKQSTLSAHYESDVEKAAFNNGFVTGFYETLSRGFVNSGQENVLFISLKEKKTENEN